MQTKYEKLCYLLDELQGAEDDKQPSCSCHISPPCSHCCNENVNDAQSAIDEHVADWELKD